MVSMKKILQLSVICFFVFVFAGAPVIAEQTAQVKWKHLSNFVFTEPAAIPFAPVVIDSNGPYNPWVKMFGDLNNDGHADIIIGGYKGPLVWYRYPTWTKAVIADGGYNTVDGALGDMDADGDNDIVMGGMLWYENPLPSADPGEKPWKAHFIADHPTHDVRVADLDKDGDLDIVTRNQSEFGHKEGNKIYVWLQNSLSDFSQHVINCPQGEGVIISDIDRDGDEDIVIPGLWFENTPEIARGLWKEHKYADWHCNASIQTADINGDGFSDVILAPAEYKENYYKISWFQVPQDAKKDKWFEHIIAEPVESIVHALAAADMNGDGVIDIVTAQMHQGIDPDEVAVYINKGKGLAWKKQVLSTRGSHCIRTADFDNDGDMDIMGANFAGPYQVVEMWENQSSKTAPATEYKSVIPKADVGRQAACLVFDIDKDGTDDFVIAGWGDTSMVWMRRIGWQWQRYLIDNRKSHIEAGGAYFDIDGDGDLDILQGGSWATNEVWWWENPYPQFQPQVPWNRYTIKTFGEKQHHDQIFGDFDGDGKAELVFWNQQAQRLFIADIPENPKDAKAWSFTEIWSWPRKFKYEGLAKIDIDLDGKIDLIGGGYWFKHNRGTSYTAEKIDDYGTSRSAAGDFIKGGRPEVVLGSGDGTGPLNLYEYVGNKWVKHTLIEKVVHGHTLQAVDINGDSNLDIYAAEMYRPGAGQDCRQWVLYGDGTGKFKKQLVSIGIGTHEARLGDLDGDGDLDILQKDFQEHQRVDIWLNEGMLAGGWWNSNYRYRLPVEVSAAGYERIDKPVEAQLNFTDLLRKMGVSSAFNENSIRIVEADTAGAVIDESVMFQFDKVVDYKADRNAKGTLVFILKGVTSADRARKYHVYFETAELYHPPARFEPMLSFEDNVDYEGQMSFKITTPGCTYYYHKKGGGFASMIDAAGNDWISYHQQGGSAGNYRGIPNMAPAGFHPGPGEGNLGSRFVSTGPIKATFYSTGKDGQWKCKWEIYPKYARMTLLEKGPQPYWILYEGTPAGKLDVDRDYWVQSSGLKLAVSRSWIGDIDGPEWVYFGDSKTNRVLYLALHEDDDKQDQFWQMQGNMTVFGFGRQYRCCDTYMTAVPAHLTIGFAEDNNFEQVGKVINSAYTEPEISVLPVERAENLSGRQ